MKKLDELIQSVRMELGADFIATDVVGMDGLSIAGDAVKSSFGADEASARLAIVMKLATKVSARIKMGQVEDTLITTDKAFIITRFLGDGSYYWSLTVTDTATLGMIRLIMKDYANQIWDAIPR